MAPGDRSAIDTEPGNKVSPAAFESLSNIRRQLRGRRRP